MPRTGRPVVKGRTVEGSRVLAVRIDKNTYEDFVLVCEKNNLDKADVVERLLVEWMIQNVDRKTFKLKGDAGVTYAKPLKVTSPTIRSRTEGVVSEPVNICPKCGGKLSELEPNVFWCNECNTMFKTENGHLKEVG